MNGLCQTVGRSTDVKGTHQDTKPPLPTETSHAPALYCRSFDSYTPKTLYPCAEKGGATACSDYVVPVSYMYIYCANDEDLISIECCLSNTLNAQVKRAHYKENNEKKNT